jgi:hypothetical protein
MAWRVTLCAPPAPTTQLVSACSTVPSACLISTSSPSSRWRIDATSLPRSTVPPSSVSRLASISSVRHCGRLHSKPHGESVPAKVISATGVSPGSNTRANPRCMDEERISSTTPAWVRISSVPGCSAVARACLGGTGSRSMTRVRTPRRDNSTAANKPDGPAPMTSTSPVVSVSPAMITHPRDPGYEGLRVCLSPRSLGPAR